ncbi:MAG: class I SAM-dependent methyltransferase [Nitrospirota bacterium]
MPEFSAYYENARKEIAPLVPQGAKSVLEIGCGAGGTLLWLKEDLGFEVCVGIEVEARAAARARQKGLAVLETDIEKGIPFMNCSYDLLLCLDVIEHLANPWRVTKELSTLIKPGGYLIVSLPNIAHISILSGLLFRDRWDYEDSGILDRTHLRFFTRQTAYGLLNEAGFEVIGHRPRFARKTHRRLNFLTIGIFGRFLTYQNLFLAKKR